MISARPVTAARGKPPPSDFAVTQMSGPYRIASGWWEGERGHERDYHFVETRTGEVLWIFYDRVLRRWFVQGVVD